MGTAWGRAIILLVALVSSASCGCSAEVVADVVVQLGDGGQTTTPASYCAQECGTTKDCPRWMHCSLHDPAESGLCFADYDAGPP